MIEHDLFEVEGAQVAMYLDMDNVVAGLYDSVHGKLSWRNDNPNARRDRERSRMIRERLEAARVDIGSIIDYGSSFGQIAVNRGYGNWSAVSNERYASDLLYNSVDLVQLFPVSGTKNGADIRLAIDVIEDLTRYPHITHVVIVAGDSDYISLAQRCKRLGRQVIGIGISGSTNRYFQLSCDEFRFYHRLPGVMEEVIDDVAVVRDESVDRANQVAAPAVTILPGGAQEPERTTPPDLLVARAAALVTADSEAEWFALAPLKQQMRRLDPAFDETALGFRNFKAFLAAWPALVEMRIQGEHGNTYFRVASGANASTRDEAGTGSRPASAVASGSAVAQTPDEVGGAGSTRNPDVEVATNVGLLRKQYGWDERTIFGSEWERAVVTVVRTARTLTEGAALSTLTTKELTVAACAASTEHTVLAVRLAAHTVTGMLPLLLRDADGTLLFNREFENVDDATLVERARAAAAARNAAKSFPDSVAAADVVRALYADEDVPAGAAATVADALAVPTAPAMVRVLGADHLPPLVLVDLATALATVPGGIAFYSNEDFASFLTPALHELGLAADREVLATFFRLLVDCGALTDGGDASAGWHNTTHRADPDVIATAVVERWIARLLAARVLQPESWLSMEALYRVAIPDFMSADGRATTRNAVDAVLAAR